MPIISVWKIYYFQPTSRAAELVRLNFVLEVRGHRPHLFCTTYDSINTYRPQMYVYVRWDALTDRNKKLRIFHNLLQIIGTAIAV
jgi:hypothetical protein